MATTYPTTLDTLTRPNSGDPLALSNGKSQTQILDDAQDAIEALEAKVGVNSSAVSTSLDKRVSVLEIAPGGIPATLLDAKGDVIAATADNVAVRVPVGANDTFFIADSAQTPGVKWAGGATARTALGLGTMAVATAANYLPLLAAGAAVEDVGAIESRASTVASSGASQTLDTSLYAFFDVTMSANCTFTFSNPAPSGNVSTFVLILRGAFTPTLPASVKWADATPPAYATPAVYTFTTINAGTVWFASRVGKAFA